ncbi:MAG: hypothetical protein EHM43_10460 [Ignavibacteriae bacterium]|nr:MAG: hypothetical protein EHM43_10460 [Ignavibacteriota bacterium]
MKKLLLIALAVVFMSCGGPEEKSAGDVHTEHQHQTAAPTGLALNNGVKWKADAATNTNVKAVVSVLDAFNASSARSLDDYLGVATKLQVSLDKLIGDCKMQGPDHDALHLWLHPLLERLDALMASTTADEARLAYKAVDEQARLYNIYFE